MPYAKRIFVIDIQHKRYIVHRGKQETIIPWRSDYSPAHLIHMAGLMHALGYRVRTLKPIPAHIKYVSPSQAARILGCSVGAIYSRIRQKTIRFETVPNRTNSGHYFRIPVDAIARFSS